MRSLTILRTNYGPLRLHVPHNVKTWKQLKTVLIERKLIDNHVNYHHSHLHIYFWNTTSREWTELEDREGFCVDFNFYVDRKLVVTHITKVKTSKKKVQFTPLFSIPRVPLLHSMGRPRFPRPTLQLHSPFKTFTLFCRQTATTTTAVTIMNPHLQVGRVQKPLVKSTRIVTTPPLPPLSSHDPRPKVFQFTKKIHPSASVNLPFRPPALLKNVNPNQEQQEKQHIYQQQQQEPSSPPLNIQQQAKLQDEDDRHSSLQFEPNIQQHQINRREDSHCEDIFSSSSSSSGGGDGRHHQNRGSEDGTEDQQNPTTTAARRRAADEAVPSQLLRLPGKKGSTPLTRTFPCEFCGIVYKHSSSMNRHLKSHHAGQIPPSKMDRVIECEYCGQQLNKHQLTNHLKACEFAPRNED